MFPSGAEVPSPLRAALPPWVIAPKIKELAAASHVVHGYISSIHESSTINFAQYSRSDLARQHFLQRKIEIAITCIHTLIPQLTKIL